MSETPLHIDRLTFDPEDEGQRAQLLTLFAEAFGDQYTEYYRVQLQTLGSPQHTFIFGYEGEVVAHIQVVPYVYRSGEDRLPVAYLYAVCTRSSMRGRGVMRDTVMPTVLHEIYKSGYRAAFLVPSSRELIAFYEPFGFRYMSTKAYCTDRANTAPMILPGGEALAYEAATKSLEESVSLATDEMPLEAGWMLHRPSWEVIDLDTSIVRPLT